MTQFYYQAKSDPKTVIDGTIEATTKEAAVRRIEEMGYFPIKVEEVRGQKISEGKISSARLNPRTITRFSRQLGTLIKSGVPILKALEIILTQTDERLFGALLSGIYSDIKEGQNLSSSLGRYPKVFSHFYISMIRTGESSGTLEQVLFRIAAYREKQHDIASKIRVAMVYPLVMFFVGLGTVIFMLSYVMPRLMNIFATIDSDLPGITKMLLAISNFLQHRWPLIVVIAAVFAFIFQRQRKRPGIKTLFSSVCLHAPFIKGFTMKKTLARFSRTLEILLRSGIPILKALELTVATLDNEIIKTELNKSLKDLEGGGSFGASLKKSRIFPTFATSLVSVGEESGRLDEALGELADTYEKELEEQIRILMTLLEPLMILLMGSVVGFVVMAMLLPIFQINIMVH